MKGFLDPWAHPGITDPLALVEMGKPTNVPRAKEGAGLGRVKQ